MRHTIKLVDPKGHVIDATVCGTEADVDAYIEKKLAAGWSLPGVESGETPPVVGALNTMWLGPTMPEPAYTAEILVGEFVGKPEPAEVMAMGAVVVEASTDLTDVLTEALQDKRMAVDTEEPSDG